MNQQQQDFYNFVMTGNYFLSKHDFKRMLDAMGSSELIEMRDKIRSQDFYHVTSEADIISFTNLRESGLSAEDAAAAVALATGEVPAKAWDHPDSPKAEEWIWGEPTQDSYSSRKEPKKQLPFYHGKRRF